VDFTPPPIDNATTGKIYPPMREFNKVEGAACGLSHRPVVDTSSSRIFGKDGCNRGSGRDHAALHWGAAFANGLAVRRGHSEGSSRDLAASHCPTPSSFPPFC